MSYNIGTEENPVEVFVAVSGTTVDASIRCPSREVFEQVAISVGMRYEVMQDVTDEETGEVTKVGTGEYRYARGIDVDHVGPIVITPGTYAEDGTEITPPVIDTRHHVNFRMTEPASTNTDADGNILWHQWALAWSATGQDDTQINAEEQAKVLNGVALIDPSSIRSPSRVFL